MKKICNIYVPGVYRQYGEDTIYVLISHLFPIIKEKGFGAVYLCGLWDSEAADIGFVVKNYTTNPIYGDGTLKEIIRVINPIYAGGTLKQLIRAAHDLGLEIGCDIVVNHISKKHEIYKKWERGVQGYMEKKPNWTLLLTFKASTVSTKIAFLTVLVTLRTWRFVLARVLDSPAQCSCQNR